LFIFYYITVILLCCNDYIDVRLTRLINSTYLLTSICALAHLNPSVVRLKCTKKTAKLKFAAELWRELCQILTDF